MEENKNEKSYINKNTDLSKVISENFGELSKDNQKLVITQLGDEQSKGVLDKIFGNKKVEVYVSWIMCIFLLFIGLFNTGLWDKIFPIITLTLGYIFGKNNNDNKEKN